MKIKMMLAISGVIQHCKINLSNTKKNVIEIHKNIKDIIIKSLLTVESSINNTINSQVVWKANCFEI